jgi:hypothetical protein
MTTSGVEVASSGNVPPLVSKTRSPASSEVGIVTVNEPSTELAPDLATSRPADFTITTDPIAGPASTVPDTDVEELDELLPELPPLQPKIAGNRQSIVISLAIIDEYDFM